MPGSGADGALAAFALAWEREVPLVEIVGAAGSGKTRLAGEVSRWALARGAVVGRGSPGARGVAFGAWVTATRALGPGAEVAWARFAEGAAGEASDAVARREAALARLFEELLGAAAGRAVLLVLDDVDRGDRATRVALDLLARRGGPRGLHVVATARDDAGVGETRPGSVVRLASRRLDVATLGAELRGAVGAATLEALVEGTAGHAGLALACAAAALAQPVEAPLDLPPSYDALVASRVARLAPALRRALAALALAGGAASLVDLAAVVDAPALALGEDLRGAGEVGVELHAEGLVELPSATARARALAPVAAAERRVLELAWAVTLGRRGGAGPARQAWHRVEALPLGRVDAALELARHGATELLRARAFEDAVALAEAALGAIPAGRGDPRATAELELLTSRAALSAGRRVDAWGRAQVAADAFAALGDPDAHARAALAAHAASAPAEHRALARRLDAALLALGEEPSPLRARVVAARSGLGASPRGRS